LRQWVIDSALRQWGGAFGQRVPIWNIWPLDARGVVETIGAVPAGAGAAATEAMTSQAAGHSGTNNQEAGVEEADIFPTDGNFLSPMADGKLLIIDVRTPEAPAIVGQIALDHDVNAFYLVGDKVVLLSNTYDTGDFSPGPIESPPIFRIAQP